MSAANTTAAPELSLKERWMPDRVTRRVRALAWWVFATQVLIIATGGAVRLTGSGLGCDTWPKCTADSFVNNPEMGIHSYIEFGNRTLTILLEVVAILALLAVWRFRQQRPDLFWLTVVPTLSVLVQAVVGGIVVWSGLNPYLVGLHFFASLVLVVLAALLVLRVYTGPGPRRLVASAPLLQMAWLATIFGFVVVALGILTTGSGPHAGDGGALRNGLDSETIQTVHVVAAYGTLLFTLMTLFLARRERAYSVSRWAGWTIVVILAQIIVGIVQARLSLPPVLVGLHMVLACLLAAGVFLALVETRQPSRGSQLR
ncbi:heme A synthase [Leucobacter insecticola]|uniref:Heme A synthase n=1 Tax=Leucobacter insecticola TaxID=2714934 RepID=A0A6G8FJM5_9MICO|nr:COX15/CtaA family protein [Leucobacter insecticola]QIM16503.1 heme A synthase [Leucobacter insecticola]